MGKPKKTKFKTKIQNPQPASFYFFYFLLSTWSITWSMHGRTLEYVSTVFSCTIKTKNNPPKKEQQQRPCIYVSFDHCNSRHLPSLVSSFYSYGTFRSTISIAMRVLIDEYVHPLQLKAARRTEIDAGNRNVSDSGRETFALSKIILRSFVRSVVHLDDVYAMMYIQGLGWIGWNLDA